MPIYEYACPKCRVIFNFLSKRINPKNPPACPKCGNRRDMTKQVSAFAMISGGGTDASAASGDENADTALPDMDDPKVEKFMRQMERDMDHLDENNPRHMAQMLRKMKEIMPPGAVPKEFDVAVRRLEAGEDPDKIEAEMGDVLGLGGEEAGGGGGGGAGSYTKDSGLYDY